MKLPHTIKKPILVYYKADRYIDKIYICWPSGRVVYAELDELPEYFRFATPAMSAPRRGWGYVRDCFVKRGLKKIIHWEYL